MNEWFFAWKMKDQKINKFINPIYGHWLKMTPDINPIHTLYMLEQRGLLTTILKGIICWYWICVCRLF